MSSPAISGPHHITLCANCAQEDVDAQDRGEPDDAAKLWDRAAAV